MAEGIIVVPLYARQAPAELVVVMKDCGPKLICAGDRALRDGIAQLWSDGPPQFLFEEVFASSVRKPAPEGETGEADPVSIIYTSGTSGEPKGVVWTAGNISYTLGCTSRQLGLLTEDRPGQDVVFHFLPFSFGASRMAVLSYLLRGGLVRLNTDLTKVSSDMPQAAANYFLNVPAILERMRKAVEEQMGARGGLALALYRRAKLAWGRKQARNAGFGDAFWLELGRRVLFPVIKKKMVGANLRALITGSAPLAIETQLYFAMLGIMVLQVYGLTETTGICTLDDPRRVVPGRVGHAISGVEMRVGDNEEILVRGPNIFPGYWNRPQETASAFEDGWFKTGDQGEVDASGNWRIVGRIKNLIILSSGHKILPEPIEEKLLGHLPGGQVVVVGNGRSYLCALVRGTPTREQVQRALDVVNPELAHYKQVRAFQVSPELFSPDNGMLTTNGKLKRDAILRGLHSEIEAMYPAAKSA
jgi:long-chain acyl-CoA synthetase